MIYNDIEPVVHDLETNEGYSWSYNKLSELVCDLSVYTDDYNSGKFCLFLGQNAVTGYWEVGSVFSYFLIFYDEWSPMTEILFLCNYVQQLHGWALRCIE